MLVYACEVNILYIHINICVYIYVGVYAYLYIYTIHTYTYVFKYIKNNGHNNIWKNKAATPCMGRNP